MREKGKIVKFGVYEHLKLIKKFNTVEGVIVQRTGDSLAP